MNHLLFCEYVEHDTSRSRNPEIYDQNKSTTKTIFETNDRGFIDKIIIALQSKSGGTDPAQKTRIKVDMGNGWIIGGYSPYELYNYGSIDLTVRDEFVVSRYGTIERIYTLYFKSDAYRYREFNGIKIVLERDNTDYGVIGYLYTIGYFKTNPQIDAQIKRWLP